MSILFLCTGNWYRSRFAEALVKHAVGDSRHVFSRGLEVKRIAGNLPPSFEDNGMFSVHTGNRLKDNGIDPYEVLELRGPIQVTANELHSSLHVIALDRAEHQPMMANLFPEHADTITYWDVPDVPKQPHHVGYDLGLPSCPPVEALARIEQLIASFVTSL